MNVAQRKLATRWFARKAFRELQNVCGVDSVEIFDAVSAIDDWFDADPSTNAAGATNQAVLVKTLPARFKAGTTADEKSLLLVAVTLGRAGLIG